jgi:hypothetical protein
MLLVVALMGLFCLMGLSARNFDVRARRLLLFGIAALITLDFVGRLFS